jgi:SAM-dependent methyltransferase
MSPSPLSPDFSPLAGRYARARPTYPREWYGYLVALLDRRELAWDAATGNGQAALGLVDHFPRVVATDISDEQIRRAVRHPAIEYRVAASENAGLESGSVDLVTAAAAAHWFDLETFGAEVRRVTRPGGILAAWTYHVGIMRPPFDRLFHRFYFDTVGPHFAAGARLVDELYATLSLPGRPITPLQVDVRASWNLDQMVEFIHSWSGTAAYREAEGHDPVDLIREELASLWGPADAIHTLAWPLHARVQRV